MEKRESIKFLLIILFAVAYLHLQFLYFSPWQPHAALFSYPSVYGGDAIHYLITTMSLIDDFDFDLKNNYYYAKKPDGVHSSTQRFTGMELDHHATYIHPVTKEQVGYWEIITALKGENTTASSGKSFNLSDYKAYSDHPIGLPLLAFPFLFPFRHSQVMDAWAALLSGLFALLGFFFLYQLLAHFDPKHALLITTIFGFATPLWPYAKSFFSEAYTWPLMTMSLYFILVKKKYVLAGFLLALMYLMKTPFALVIFFTALFILATEKRIMPVFFFLLPFFFSVSFSWFYNYLVAGNPFYTSQPYIFANPLIGLHGFFLHKQYGLFVFSPILLYCFFGIKGLVRERKNEAVLLFLTALSIIAFLAPFYGEQGGCCTGAQYSARYLVPLLPIFAILLLFGYKQIQQSIPHKLLFYALLVLSLLITLQGALFIDLTMGIPSSPWQTFKILFL